jgi:hypothetical protein
LIDVNMGALKKVDQVGWQPDKISPRNVKCTGIVHFQRQLLNPFTFSAFFWLLCSILSQVYLIGDPLTGRARKLLLPLRTFLIASIVAITI